MEGGDDMARYIDLEELVKRINDNIKPETLEEKALIEWCKDECIRQGYAMPVADVVPKSEYDAVVSAVDNSTKEFLKLHDDYQEAKCELEELKKDRYQIFPDGRIELIPRSDVKALEKEVEMLQGALKAEERHNELTMKMAQKALQNAKAEVAREIFEEIERLMENNEVWFRQTDEIREDFSKLKKKYTGG